MEFDPFPNGPPDYLADDADNVEHETRKATGKPMLPLVKMGRWKGEPPARRSLWGDWLPLHQTTMLTGAGGVGKSLFDQALCTAIALGIPFLGMDTVQRNTLYITCEDDEDELWRRQYDICDAFGVGRRDVIGKLHLCHLTGTPDTALAAAKADNKEEIEPTDRWHELRNTCDAFDIGLFAFDNATDALAADHNQIHPVAAFVNMLTGLAIERDGVAMIIHHPNKSGDDWLGSVAWHNKVRSRLIIKKTEDEADADARTITNPKANYGPSGGVIDFRWHKGCFVREDDMPSDTAAELRKTIQAQHENTVFLDCLRATAEQGREVSDKVGPNYAPARFANMTEAKGVKKPALARAMERLFHIGAIELVEVKRKGSETKKVIAEVQS